MKIAILLPAYNEEKNIRYVIKEAKQHLKSAEIVIVDDGSTDKTYELAKKEGAIVLRHKVNLGKGEAIKTGFSYLKKTPVEAILIADADKQYSLKEGKKLLKPLIEGKADFVMGKRNFKKIPFRHRLGNLVWRSFFNFLFGTNLKDTNCGYIALNRRALEKIKRIHGGYIIENAFLTECIRNNLRIGQVPVSVRYRKKTKILKGIRMVAGVLIFIISEGIKYRVENFLNFFKRKLRCIFT